MQKKFASACLLGLVLLWTVALAPSLPAQNEEPSVPEVSLASPGTAAELPALRVIRISGVLSAASGFAKSSAAGSTANAGPQGVTFALYREQESGAPLWLEQHNVLPDEQGRYIVLLGSAQPEGLPLDLFSTGEARWLGVQTGSEPEQPRILLVSVPYALKAADAETLGGQPLTAFILRNQPAGGTANDGDNTTGVSKASTDVSPALFGGAGTPNFIPKFLTPRTLGDSLFFDNGTNVGLGTLSPTEKLDVAGTVKATGFVGDNTGTQLLDPNGFGRIAILPGFRPNFPPSVVGGYLGNTIWSGVRGGTISGGGKHPGGTGGVGTGPNIVASDWGAVGGGAGNLAGDPDCFPCNWFATVGGGQDNSATAPESTIGGGRENVAGTTGATIGGGTKNTASGNSAGGNSTVAGGYANTASGADSAIGGGRGNLASGDGARVAGGYGNVASGDVATVAGGYDNSAIAIGATIGGGGKDYVSRSGKAHFVTDEYGTVSGGRENQAGNGELDEDRKDAAYATVGGGYVNVASAYAATVGGGLGNRATSESGTVSGGAGNRASGDHAAVGGGKGNHAAGRMATVGGGMGNNASALKATVAGGGIVDESDSSTGNRATDDFGTIGGGGNNQAGDNLGTADDRPFATVAGGNGNTASGALSAIGGGAGNTASNNGTTVSGGAGNVASGPLSAVPGGASNTAAGLFSFAAGFRAKANHIGSFVWADATNADVPSTNVNQFTVRATGGAVFLSNSAGTTGVNLPPGGGSWSALSDRNVKENFAELDGADLLDRLDGVPMQSWNYRTQEASIRHIGPMAQDFYAAFGVGEDDRHISAVDADGVALAAAQQLYRMVQEKAAETRKLREELSQLRERLALLETSQDGTSGI